MLTNDQINALKKELMQMKEEQLTRLNGQHYGLELELLKESVGELSNYDNHPGDQGTELYEREKDIALNEHSEQLLDEIDNALKAIEEGSYGKCEVCGTDIPYERLEAIPNARRCIQHAEEKSVSNKRPVEEDVIAPAFGEFEYDESVRNETFFDAEDAWQTVSIYGSSETPSDFLNVDNKDYNNMFVESEEPIGIVEDIEGILTADIEGNYSGPSVDHKEYEQYLDENDVTSVLDGNKKEEE
ncbi:TraR/DksA C4-type zinc finger protein [Evansella cellulosilytica]|uniref:Transcriptional regulator, TraR/DksA family n=1 Tax=Evansella cellulosilytica (strain ATCC 21833 / DSM 2522 / FERM P-1141 / JCM 9156 / N-4) TaxID=649639 RepID=E6TU98_EVAC2|nr:TraR/DksA C4-type zinc finger protein [Evansella cellulosilytica]ADU28558.1 transcriptional regulator, TraR/DksA family [Evansella cellulosilytica DSM 2522]